MTAPGQLDLRAFTLQRPWGWALLFAGKDIENRSWPLPKNAIGKRQLIHQGKTYDKGARWLTAYREALESWAEAGSRGIAPDAEGILGGLIFTGSHLAAPGCCESPWALAFDPDPDDGAVHHWQAADPRPLAEPIPAKGALGFWAPPPAVLEAVSTAIQIGALR
jgi:hypothetical protein